METESDTPREVTYDDLSIGQRFVSGRHQLDESQIIEFATQFDPQPFHTDPVAARGTVFGGLVASGWHTAAITMRLLMDSGLRIEGGMVGAGGRSQLATSNPARRSLAGDDGSYWKEAPAVAHGSRPGHDPLRNSKSAGRRRPGP